MREVRTSVLLSLVMVLLATHAFAEPANPVHEDAKCPVCGMYVAKFDQWLAQIVDTGTGAGAEPLVFDGVKDMMAFYFDPPRYGSDIDMSTVEIWVRNYYTLDYIDGRTALYVLGSDVRGPMGDELIPFATMAEAENFMKDHRGTEIVRFDDIGAGLITEMKKKHMMKMKKMKSKMKP